MTNVVVGTTLPPQTFRVTRFDLVRYAGASGDFNPIHWNERFAKSVGLPDVIAHGMFTMAEAARVVTDWLGDPGRLEEYAVRFTRPVPVADDDAGSVIEVSGEVTDLLDGGRAKIMQVAGDYANELGGNFYTASLQIGYKLNSSSTSPINSPALTYTIGIVPAPGALALLGLAGLAGRRRRA